MNEKQVEKAVIDKACPLLILAGGKGLTNQCLGDECALWINIQRPILFGDGRNSFPDPHYKHVYRGCGLVVHIPWERVKREEKPGPAE
ncbi:MAG: hypothetical protein ACE5L6_01975 [Candidatus Bathyarchaeia archaeon]